MAGVTVRVQELFLPQRSSEVRYCECRLAPSLRLAANRFALLACDLRGGRSPQPGAPLLRQPLHANYTAQIPAQATTVVHGRLLVFLG